MTDAMTDDIITRLCGVLGSLGGGVDPLVTQLERDWRVFEESREICLGYMTEVKTKLGESATKMLESLKTFERERSVDPRSTGLSCEFAKRTIKGRATIP